jgi:hypothetical protein
VRRAGRRRAGRPVAPDTPRAGHPPLISFVLALLVAAAPALAQNQRNPLPVPDVGGFRTLKCDFHMHTVFSDGLVWPTVRVREAYRQGLDVISITDHDDYQPHEDDVSMDISRAHTIAKPMADDLGIILIPGIEITKGEWHFNALFVTDYNATKDLEAREALQEAGRQGAFVFWNHPGWKRTAEWFPEIAPLHEEGLFTGVELVNGRTFYKEIFPFIDEKKLTILSNSDIHSPATEADAVDRAITLLFVRSADPEGVREALEARRSAAWMGGELWGAEPYLSGLWKGAITVGNPELAMSVEDRRTASLRLANQSAIVFDFKVLQSPEWLTVGGNRIDAESIADVRIAITKDAPAGKHSVDLELEITNLHTAPDRNLTVTIPLQVHVSPPAS